MIELKELFKVYGNSKQSLKALNSVDLVIEDGEFVSIMGPSGSGKSTLLNLIGCLDSPTSGSYILDGDNVSSLNSIKKAHLRNNSIGFVFQSFYLLNNKTALENVLLPLLYSKVSKKERRAKAEKALSTIGILELKDRYPGELSGGQLQRVAIARALVNNPDIILADEPTGNLDSHTSLEIINVFKALHDQQHKTILLVTHDAKIAAYADRNIQIIDGKIASDEKLGTKDILLFNPSRLWEEEEVNEKNQ